MSNEWFAANNVERAHQVLSAINLLSINAKLTLLGSSSPIEVDEIVEAKKTLLEFTEGLSDLLEKAEKREGRTILGTDFRTGQLASCFRDTMTRRSSTDDLHGVELDVLPSLLNAEDESSLNTLIRYLDQLRSLVEQYSYSDMVAVFGEGWS
jgi:hypothetical protein